MFALKTAAGLSELSAAGTIAVDEDTVRAADWVIDLGPEGGEAGGQLVAEGTPEAVAKVKASHTGRFLKPLLEQ